MVIVMTIGERIKEVRESKGVSQTELANAVRISKQNLYKYETGIITNIPSDKIERIAYYLEVSPAVLMGWEDIGVYNKYPEPTVTEDYTTFPVIGEVAAGYDRIATEDWTGETIDVPNSYLRGRKKSEFFVLTVRGDSMYPLYQEGDKVLILKQQMVNSSGDVGVVIYADECGTLKKVEYEKGKWIKLVPINPNYPPIIIKGEDMAHCRIIGIPRLVIREINDTL